MKSGGGARRDDRPGDGRIEHTRQREVIKTADWVLDLGPEGGDKGGEIVAEGTPEEVAEEPQSYTGGYLKQLLNGPGAEPAPSRKKKPRVRLCA
jgi:excinuclease ABC subunit A